LRGSGTAVAFAALLAVAGGAGGCRRFTKEAADREVYTILDRKRPCVPEASGALHVEVQERIACAARSQTTFRLTLRDALALATDASREYRVQREDVFLAALDLTGERNDFRPQLFAPFSGELSVDEDGTTVAASGGPSITRALATGGSVALSLATEFLRGLTTEDPLHVARTILSLEAVFPFARGSGRLVAMENLRQAERDVIYALRSYARFQQEFAVQIANDFYRVLQARDTLKNEERTHESLTQLLERQEAMGAEAAGRIPGFQVDQARQDLLRADERRRVAASSYQSQLDRFKLSLGIPVSVDVELLDDDLERLRTQETEAPEVDPERAVAVALERRLDLKNARSRSDDARRRVLVAKDGLRAQVDLNVGGALETPERSPLDVLDAEPRGDIGLDLDLPFERTAERNAYRAAIVQAVRARREVEGLTDRVVLDVREAFRAVELAERRIDIQRAGLRLAERRVENTTLLLEAGEASTRDRLEAEDALVDARNGLTSALVDLAVARLELERDMGTLLVDPRGFWGETVPGETSPSGAPCPPPPTAAGPSRAETGTPAPPRASFPPGAR
jgi:outer membrane protein TolC